MVKKLRIAILEFYKLNLNKRKENTVKHFKKSVHRATVYRWLKKFESTGNCDQKPEYGTRKATDTDLNDSTNIKKF